MRALHCLAGTSRRGPSEADFGFPLAGLTWCVSPARAGHAALDRPMLYGVVPIDSKVAAALGAVVALLAVALVAVVATWRISLRRNRKAYKKWGEEVGALCGQPLPLPTPACRPRARDTCVQCKSQLHKPQLALPCLVQTELFLLMVGVLIDDAWMVSFPQEWVVLCVCRLAQ